MCQYKFHFFLERVINALQLSSRALRRFFVCSGFTFAFEIVYFSGGFMQCAFCYFVDSWYLARELSV